MPQNIYTTQQLIDDLSKFPPETPVIAQSCCFDGNEAAGGIQVAAVRVSDDGSIESVPDDEANGVAIEIINVDA